MMMCSMLAARADAERQRRQLVERDQDPDPRVGRDVEQLARGVDRVDVDDDGAEPQDGERGDDVLRAVRQHDADAIALAQCPGAGTRRPADRCAS